ncbi:MAG: MFS transporter, partial [Muribaculaceae bacterium]
FVPATTLTGWWIMLVLQVFISVLTGVMSPLVWSMYADVSDYSELRFKTASTGLIFSSSSMAQKFGGAIGGAAVLWLLSACGYVVRDDAQMMAQTIISQPDSALLCLKMLMSFIPAGVAVVALTVCHFYPLTTNKMKEIGSQLAEQRNADK